MKHLYFRAARANKPHAPSLGIKADLQAFDTATASTWQSDVLKQYLQNKHLLIHTDYLCMFSKSICKVKLCKSQSCNCSCY